MRSGLAAAETRVAELEGLVGDYQKDQARIEESIVEALRKLDSFEDAVHEASAKPAPAKPVAIEPAAIEPPVAEPAPVEPSAQDEDLAALEEQTRPDEPSDALDIF